MVKNGTSSTTFAGIILLIFSLLGLYLGYLVMKGIFVPLLFASLMAVVFYPFYNWLLKKTKGEILSSFICCAVLILLGLVSISFVVYLAVGEVVSITKVFTKNIEFGSMSFLTDQAQLDLLVNESIASINQITNKIPFVDTSSISEVLTEILKNIPKLVQQVSTQIIGLLRIGLDSAAKWLLDGVIFIISFFFLLIDGNKFVQHSFKLLPINALHERQITKKFTNLCFAWIVVNLLLAFIQGSLAAVGYALVSVPSPLVWGVVTMLASFIPFIGSAIIWVPIAVIYIILGKFWAALFLIIWGIFISSIDNILRPFLLKEGIRIHPLIVFLAVLGGFFAFNVPGLIIGPMIMVFISTLIYIYELEFGEVLDQFHYRGGRRRS